MSFYELYDNVRVGGKKNGKKRNDTHFVTLPIRNQHKSRGEKRDFSTRKYKGSTDSRSLVLSPCT
jgi:hypothetical protein